MPLTFDFALQLKQFIVDRRLANALRQGDADSAFSALEAGANPNQRCLGKGMGGVHSKWTTPLLAISQMSFDRKEALFQEMIVRGGDPYKVVEGDVRDSVSHLANIHQLALLKVLDAHGFDLSKRPGGSTAQLAAELGWDAGRDWQLEKEAAAQLAQLDGQTRPAAPSVGRPSRL